MGNKVKVKIYGMEYTITGEKSPEEMQEVADYVDQTMRSISRAYASNTQGSLAVLTAINMADEYFTAKKTVEDLKKENVQLETNAQHYLKMWDEAKESFQKYKDNANRFNDEKKAAEERYEQLQAKCNEFESSFFDIQMENFRLKSEIERLKKEKR